jgi:hypothetical protein
VAHRGRDVLVTCAAHDLDRLVASDCHPRPGARALLSMAHPLARKTAAASPWHIENQLFREDVVGEPVDYGL